MPDPNIFVSPLVDPISWMSITVSGFTIGPADASGYVQLRNAGRPYRWQSKDASGQDGATQTYRGKSPTPFEILFVLWTDFHFFNWQALADASFIYDAGKTTVDPVDVYHPALAMVGISQMVVLDCGAPEQQGTELKWVATVKCREFFPAIATNATQTPTMATTSNDNAPGTTPDPALEQAQTLVEAAKVQAQNVGVLSPTQAGLP